MATAVDVQAIALVSPAPSAQKILLVSPPPSQSIRIVELQVPTPTISTVVLQVPGIPGPATQPIYEQEFTLAVPHDYDYTQGTALSLTIPANTGGHDLYIGGLRQSRDAYSVQATVITLPADLLLGEFDEVAFVYTPA